MAGSMLAPLTADERPGLGQLVQDARRYADGGMAAATRRAYGSDWRDFTGWCASVDACPLPAEAATVALYLTARAPQLAASTLARRLAAIRTAHRVADLPRPDSGALRAVWTGIRRAHGAPPVRKRALVTEDLRRLVRRLPPGLAGIRDRAILVVGFAAALRRCELAALALERRGGPRETVGLTFVAAGFEVEIARSKGDQLGEGQVVGVPRGRTAICPVAALRAWLDAARISAGPVWRPVDRLGRLGDGSIGGRAVARIIKRACRRAGLDPDLFGGHSLRSGLVTSAAANDVSLDLIMRQTRHVRVETVRGYIRDGERFRRNAAGKVGM